MKKNMITFIDGSIDYFYDILEDWEDCYDFIGRIFN